jgi:transcriptional regulator with XRE-family HTH domain
MSTIDIKTAEWLEDFEIREEYGSATLKYDIAAALVTARKMRNLTQATLANIAGVSQAYIAKLESGEANPTIGRIGAILAAIWLKAEINLVPLMSISDAEVNESKNTDEKISSIISTRFYSEVEQWLQRQMQHIGQQMNQHVSLGKISMGSPILNTPYITYTRPSSIEASGGLAKAIQPSVVSPENGIGSSTIGGVDMHIQLVA